MFSGGASPVRVVHLFHFNRNEEPNKDRKFFNQHNILTKQKGKSYDKTSREILRLASGRQSLADRRITQVTQECKGSNRVP